MSYEKDYYAILQINRNASQDAIERAYNRLSETYHPEKSQKKRAAQRHADVQEAYETLKDPRKRRQYDRQVAGARAAAGGMAPADVLSNRFILLSGGVIVASIGVILALVLVLGGGSGSEELTNLTNTPTASPVGQTPAPTLPAQPPDITVPFATTATGLQIATIQEGTGATPQTHDTVTVNYTGWVQGGELFDSSLSAGRTPFQFYIGEGHVIAGWDEGVATMKVGGKYRLIVPPSLAYKDQSPSAKIPANSTLIFDIEVLATATPTPVGQTPVPSDAVTPTATAEPTATTADSAESTTPVPTQ